MLYTIIETVRYEIEADSPGEAEDIYVATEDEFFVNVDDYVVFDDCGSPCLTDAGKPVPFSRGDYIQKHAEA
jgi:hypothetical protein